MINLVGGIIRDVVGIFADNLASKRKIKEAETQARIDHIRSAQQAEQKWDVVAQEGAKGSWKDEWFVLLLSVPLVGAFIPELQPYISDGFAHLDQMPDYYKAFLATAIGASFGYKAIAKPFIQKLSKPADSNKATLTQ